MDSTTYRKWVKERELLTREADANQSLYKTICPNCRIVRPRPLPKMFGGSPSAWRIEGVLAILCEHCKSQKRGERNG